jgi:hypothetical protein
MKVSQFIENHKISPALAVGFKEFLRRDPEQDHDEEFLTNSYEKFSGRKLVKTEKKPTGNVDKQDGTGGSTGGNPSSGSDPSSGSNSDPSPDSSPDPLKGSKRNK